MELNDWIEIIEWLVQQGIARTYCDKKEELNRRTAIRRIEKREYALTECQSVECEETMNNLCKFLNIPPAENKKITAQTLYNFIKTKFSLSSISNYESAINSHDSDDYKQAAADQRSIFKRDKDMLRKRYGQLHDPWNSISQIDDIIKFYGVNGHMANY
eukprot:UN01356